MRRLKKRSGIKTVSVYKVMGVCNCSCACMGNSVIWETTRKSYFKSAVYSI